MARELEPFSDEEREAAIDAATEHPEVQRLREARHRAVLVSPNIKDRRSREGADEAVVGFYDYDADRSLVAVVHPERREVLSAEEVPVQFQLSVEERREAESLAGEDERVRSFLGGEPMNPLTRLFFPPSGSPQARRHRHAIVFLRPRESDRLYAVVDLSAREVIDVFGPDDFLSQ